MEYKTFDPHPNLSAFVKCHWSLESSAALGIQRQRIIPDGCMEMIFHYGDLFRQYLDDGSSYVQPRCFVFGQISAYLEIEPTGDTGIFAVRFHPEGFLPFASFPIREMENKAVPLEKIFGMEARQLEEQVLTAGNVSERINYCEEFLNKRLVNAGYVDDVVSRTVDLILQINGTLSIDALSKKMNVNRRQLERKFSHTIGLSPKQLAKIIRMNHVFLALINNQDTPLTSLAHDGHYYDQAHFIKDFREFTGLSPKQFFSDKLKMTSLFYGEN